MSTVYNDPIMLDSTGQDIVTKLNSIASLMGDGVIDDTTASATKTYSSNKIVGLIGTLSNLATTAKNNLVAAINELVTAIANRVDWASYAKTGAKNRLGMTLAYLKSINTQGTWSNNAYTHNGVTYTVTETDGYVSNININGTADSSYSKMNIIGSSYVANKYKGMRLTGAPDGSSSTYYITTFYSNDGSSTVGSESKSYGVDGVVLGDKNYIQTLIFVTSGVSVDNVDLQPMIYDATDTDPTYQPYAMTNRELTEIKEGTIDLSHSESTTTPSAHVERTHLKRIGRTCILDFWINFVTVSETSTWKELLRVDLKPTKPALVVCRTGDNNTCAGILDIDGSLKIYPTSAINNNSVYGQVVYFI